MMENKKFKNTRTGEVATQVKIVQSSWDKSSDPEKIKDFFSYVYSPMIEIKNGDILIEL